MREKKKLMNRYLTMRKEHEIEQNYAWSRSYIKLRLYPSASSDSSPILGEAEVVAAEVPASKDGD